MLQLKLESASYSELDFPLFNGAGFTAIQRAVEVAQQTRALAQTPEDLQKAAWMMRAAADRKNHEQEIAMRNFDGARQKAFQALRKAMDALRESSIWGPKRQEMENRVDHLVTKFSLKSFAEVERDARQLLPRLSAPAPLTPRPIPSVSRPFTPPPVSRPVFDVPQSASAWFERGCALERHGRQAEAMEAYRQALQMNPRHFQAENHLNQLSAVTGRRRVS
jgi:tetratricopeptide (TPR) repeat protein